MWSLSANLLSVLKSGSSMCRAERYGLSRLERFASIEIRGGRLAEYTEGDALAARLSICVSSRGFEQIDHRKLSSLSIGSAHAF